MNFAGKELKDREKELSFDGERKVFKLQSSL
jgi:hypothetical protein